MTDRVAGVDVGGPRKGFHVAVLGPGDVVAVARAATVDEVVARCGGAVLVGVDAPAAWAPPGERSRPDERAFTRAGICGIRYTPDEATARARTDGYLDWVWQGLALYGALHAAGLGTAEVFPTASWTRWLGPRGRRPRGAWSGDGMGRLRAGGLDDAGVATDQDQRDAVAAALTARQATAGTVERFGALVVPAVGSWPLSG